MRYVGRDFGWNFIRYFARDFVRYYVRYFGRDFGRTEPTFSALWLPRFAFLEAGSVAGRAASRSALAYGEVPEGVVLFTAFLESRSVAGRATPRVASQEDGVPDLVARLALFRLACQSSFAPDDVSLRTVVAGACDTFEGDPLWPTLARHVARISSAEDRALLEDLARNPEQREPPLSWGLQYYVRGDLVFDDGSVVTLDELCAQAGLMPLPLLEAMPDELDIPLDAASP